MLQRQRKKKQLKHLRMKSLQRMGKTHHHLMPPGRPGRKKRYRMRAASNLQKKRPLLPPKNWN